MSKVRVYERDIYRTNRYGHKDKEGKPLKDHVGSETVREGFCEEHQSWSSAYEGVVDARWLFHCRGRDPLDRKVDAPHRYTVDPEAAR